MPEGRCVRRGSRSGCARTRRRPGSGGALLRALRSPTSTTARPGTCRRWRAPPAVSAGRRENSGSRRRVSGCAATRLASLGLHLRHLGGHLATHGLSDRLAVDDARAARGCARAGSKRRRVCGQRAACVRRDCARGCAYGRSVASWAAARGAAGRAPAAAAKEAVTATQPSRRSGAARRRRAAARPPRGTCCSSDAAAAGAAAAGAAAARGRGAAAARAAPRLRLAAAGAAQAPAGARARSMAGRQPRERPGTPGRAAQEAEIRRCPHAGGAHPRSVVPIPRRYCRAGRSRSALLAPS